MHDIRLYKLLKVGLTFIFKVYKTIKCLGLLHRKQSDSDAMVVQTEDISRLVEACN
jgi:hypothetical protein